MLCDIGGLLRETALQATGTRTDLAKSHINALNLITQIRMALT